MEHTAIYSEVFMQAMREKRGLAWDDTSQDEDIKIELQSGEKMSKSKHMEHSEE